MFHWIPRRLSYFAGEQHLLHQARIKSKFIVSEMDQCLTQKNTKFWFWEAARPVNDNWARSWLLTPVWKRVGGGCHLNRKMDTLIESAGFQINALRAAYKKLGPRLFAFIYEGSAAPA